MYLLTILKSLFTYLLHNYHTTVTTINPGRSFNLTRKKQIYVKEIYIFQWYVHIEKQLKFRHLNKLSFCRPFSIYPITTGDAL